MPGLGRFAALAVTAWCGLWTTRPRPCGVVAASRSLRKTPAPGRVRWMKPCGGGPSARCFLLAQRGDPVAPQESADADGEPSWPGLDRRAALRTLAVTASGATRPDPGGAEFEMS